MEIIIERTKSESYQKERELYKAIYGDSDDRLIELCQKFDDGAMHVCTIHNDTPLHKVAYIKKFELASTLLDQLPQNFPNNKILVRENNWGNTIFHNASTCDEGVEFLKKLLLKAPELLTVHNKWGETALFQASRYGKSRTLMFLAQQVDKFCESQDKLSLLHFCQRADKTTILHMAILTGHYDVALIIAKRYPELCKIQRPHDHMTALRILASTPGAFRSGTQMGLFHRLIYSCISTDNGRGNQPDEARVPIRKDRKSISSFFGIKGKPWCTWPPLDMIRSQKQSHEDVLELAKILIKTDTSWERTHSPVSEIQPVTKFDQNSGQQKRRGKEVAVGTNNIPNDSDSGEDDINKGKLSYSTGLSHTYDTPLILAAKTGCIEIVEEILDVFPTAVEHINHKGQTVFHVAVKNRNMEIFRRVLSTNYNFRSNVRDIDCYGNSILHMVGYRRQRSPGAEMNTPLLRLSEDLRVLEELKTTCPKNLINHRNQDMKTPEELFALKNEKLRGEAKEWLKKTSEHCTVVTVLIATVAFAAAYTVPGGPNQQTGYPVLIKKPFFLAFTMTDVLSLTFALTAVVIFLAILTSSFRLKSFCRSLPQKLMLGLTLLFLSVSMMMVSFAATVILMTNDREHWTKIAVYIAAFFPVCIFMLSYVPLYIQLAETFQYWGKKFRGILPVFAPASTA